MNTYNKMITFTAIVVVSLSIAGCSSKQADNSKTTEIENQIANQLVDNKGQVNAQAVPELKQPEEDSNQEQVQQRSENGKVKDAGKGINENQSKSQTKNSDNKNQIGSANSTVNIIKNAQTKKTQPSSSKTVQKPTQSTKKVTEVSSAKRVIKKETEDEGIKILKSEVTSMAKFYPYVAENTKMEVIAVKASDGSIRTALNTCQICFDSGRGYYVQQGQYLVCQNCGNVFGIDDIEKIKGGCNPVPVMDENRKDNGNYIIIDKSFLESQKNYFANWKI